MMNEIDEMKLFRKEYKKAVKENKKIFYFNGQEILTDYAKYLLEYYDLKIKSN